MTKPALAMCMDTIGVSNAGMPSPGRSDPGLSLIVQIHSCHSCSQILHWLQLMNGWNIIFIHLSCGHQIVS